MASQKQETIEESLINIGTLVHGISVPPQPQLVADLVIEQLDPFSTETDIAKIARKDIGIAGSLLKAVNSKPFISTRNNQTNKPILSIELAINLLGISTVVDIANAIAQRNALDDDTIISLTTFWDLAIDTAQFCEKLSVHLNVSNPDEAYALGLLHNCGLLLMKLRFEDFEAVLEEAYQFNDKRIVDTENRYFKTNHAVLGYYVAKSWKLPEHLCTLIAEHHNIDKYFGSNAINNQEQKDLFAILKMAEHLSYSYSIIGKQNLDYEWENIGTAILDHTGLSDDDFNALEEQLI